MVNRYRVDLNHDDGRGIDFEVYADDEAAALEQGLASAPAGAFAERVVPMEIDVEPPLPPDPPIADGEDAAAYAARCEAARQEAREAARVAAQERQAAIDRGETPALGDLPPLPVPEWPELTEVEAAVWEARKAAAEAKAAADAEAKAAAEAAVPALEHELVEAHEPTRAEAREARAAAKAEARAERDDARRR